MTFMIGQWTPGPLQLSTPDMVRKSDPETSCEAAERVARRLPGLQSNVWLALWSLGPMTDGELEKLPQFAGCAPSTVRKRRTELRDAGYVVDTGRVKLAGRSRMTIWEARVLK